MNTHEAPAFTQETMRPLPPMQPSAFAEFASFRTMVTPTAIQVLFWVGVIGTILLGLTGLVHGAGLSGFLIMVAGPLMVRIYCELVILGFRAYEMLKEIAANTRR